VSIAQLFARQARHRDGHRRGRHRQAADHRHIRHQRQRDAEDGRVRRRIAAIVHPPPDHETARRPRRQRDADARQPRAHQKIVENAHDLVVASMRAAP